MCLSKIVLFVIYCNCHYLKSSTFEIDMSSGYLIVLSDDKTMV